MTANEIIDPVVLRKVIDDALVAGQLRIMSDPGGRWVQGSGEDDDDD